MLMHKNWFFTSQKETIQHWAVIFGNEKRDWTLTDPTRLMKFETFSSKVNILKTLSTVYQNKPKVKNKEKQANQFSHPHPNTVETREDEN